MLYLMFNFQKRLRESVFRAVLFVLPGLLGLVAVFMVLNAAAEDQSMHQILPLSSENFSQSAAGYGASYSESNVQSRLTVPVSTLTGRLTYQTKRYRLGAGDTLKLEVLGEPDYTQDNILINPDGYTSILGVGEIDMGGRTVSEVQQEITAILERTLVSPQVSVSIVKTKPGMVYLSGAVQKPGMVQFATDSHNTNVHVNSQTPLALTNMRLTNILANAGGVQLNADLSNVQVRDIGSGVVTTVDLWAVLKNGMAEQDLFVNSGDAIFIPQLPQMALDEEEYQLLLRSAIGPKNFNVRVIGEVSTPGLLELDGRSPFLNSAIAKAGGFAPQANKHQIAIRRFTTEEQFSTFFVSPDKMDITLRPNDVVYISERRVYQSGRFMEQVASILKPFQTVASVAAYSSQVFGTGGWDRRNF